MNIRKATKKTSFKALTQGLTVIALLLALVRRQGDGAGWL
jgi:hypothetical protein